MWFCSLKNSNKNACFKICFLSAETLIFQNLVLLCNTVLKTFCRHYKNRCIELPKEESTKEETETKHSVAKTLHGYTLHCSSKLLHLHKLPAHYSPQNRLSCSPPFPTLERKKALYLQPVNRRKAHQVTQLTCRSSPAIFPYGVLGNREKVRYGPSEWFWMQQHSPGH